MSTVALTPPVRIDRTAVNVRPGLPRLVAVELRKVVDTRSGFWLQVATVALAAAVVIARCVSGEAADHTFVAVLDVGIQPAAVLLPVMGLLLVTSEWSQRTGLITFTLVPGRGRVLAAKALASLLLATASFLISVAIVTIGVLAASHGAVDAWADAPALVGQSAVFVTTGVLGGVAFGAMLLGTAPALVTLFALPIAWAAVVSLPIFGDAAPWLDTLRALGPMHQEVMDATQWGHAGTALLLWTVLPLVLGAVRVTRSGASV